MPAAATVFLLAVAIGLAAFAFWQQRRFGRRISEAELRRLRAQLDPHFLFNALNVISELGYDDPEAADRAITRLSGLLRRSLDESRQQEISLRAELDFLEDYLALQRLLMRDELAAAIVPDPQSLHARVPAMILQPLVENALTHGRPKSGGGRIHISAAREGDGLRIEVRDNGPGLNANAPPGRRPGIGIANTRTRLRLLYGKNARLELKNGGNGGAIACLILPFREAP
jgi:LytS/YehU family sensor histidine kinase